MELLTDYLNNTWEIREGKEMICPKCKSEIDYVEVTSRAYARGYVEGNRITRIERVELDDMNDFIYIGCPKCEYEFNKDGKTEIKE